MNNDLNESFRFYEKHSVAYIQKIKKRERKEKEEREREKKKRKEKVGRESVKQFRINSDTATEKS